jgi:hypothetical protein
VRRFDPTAVPLDQQIFPIFLEKHRPFTIPRVTPRGAVQGDDPPFGGVAGGRFLQG